MKLFSYIVARDYGFAPNPFYGYCTLATCKSQIRRVAQVNDWVVGTGSKRKKLDGHVVFIMEVSEVMTYDEYWNDERFSSKKPNLHSCLKHAYGDNIYHKVRNDWAQENSHHSFADGCLNVANVLHDTKSNRILISQNFTYWGKEGPKIPRKFRKWRDLDICHQHPGHKCNFPEQLVNEFLDWYYLLDQKGYVGIPSDLKI